MPQLNNYEFTVTVAAATREEAEQIMTERINHDEDLSTYGIGDYWISFR